MTDEAPAVWRDPRALLPWDRNPVIHPPEQIARLRETIRRYGFGAPILVQLSTGRIVAGHGRQQAALAEGLERVPVREMDLSDDEARDLAIADNRIPELASWDDAKLAQLLREAEGGPDWSPAALGYSDQDVAALLAAHPPADPSGPTLLAGDAAAEPADDPEDDAAAGEELTEEGARLMALLRPSGLQAPFQWFGGKRRVAGIVWAALGAPRLYVEPFAGSLAVLLGRPESSFPEGAQAHEHVNDLDDYLVNFWRATVADPEAVAAHCDWPATEADLHARHLWLVNEGRRRLAEIYDDPAAFDAQVAGWWAWGLSLWIGGGWCAAGARRGDATAPLPGMADAAGDRGVHAQRPHLGGDQGVHAQLPHLGGDQGVHAQLPHLGGDQGQCAATTAALRARFGALRDRLRRVKVIRGPWDRVLTEGALCAGGPGAGSVGIFLDPPYDTALRADGCYAVGEEATRGTNTVSTQVRAWCVAHGDDPRLRIVLAGYAAEHEAAMPSSWRCVAWASKGAYQRRASLGTTRGAANRTQERLWFSPACLPLPDAAG